MQRSKGGALRLVLQTFYPQGVSQMAHLNEEDRHRIVADESELHS